jgi:hypothetical protein
MRMRTTRVGSGRSLSRHVAPGSERHRGRPVGFATVVATSALALVSVAPAACSSKPPGAGAGDAASSGTTGTSSGSSSGSGVSGSGSGSSSDFGDGGLGNNVNDDAGGNSSSGDSDGGVACPTGLQCNATCTGGATTTVTGKVYDPALKNPLYNVAVYVPAVPLTPLPAGVPTGTDACSCGALFTSGALTNTSTAEDGTFTLTNVPVGAKVPLVLQIGKWRRQVTINVTACQANAQADKSLAFLGTVPAGDTDDNIPDIAISTGSADTLECLMLRIGVPATEYVAGASTSGHVHIFAGGGAGTGHAGTPEANQMAGSPASPTSLWASQAQLMPYDIVLLSCEGGETFDANPAALEAYLNAGGRAFGSHFHYAWFSGPIASTGATYTAPTDWGANLATWVADQGNANGPIGGQLDTTLNGSTAPFSKGVSLQKWLTNVNALGQNGVAAGELSIYSPRFNATVAATNTPSQPWISADSASTNPGATMYFSFDTPVKPAPLPDGGAGPYCGRAVFSDLHVSGDPSEKDTGNSKGKGGGSPPPAGCDNTDLSPQEKALEFMLFDLSSCVIPDTVTVPKDGGLPPPPPK